MEDRKHFLYCHDVYITYFILNISSMTTHTADYNKGYQAGYIVGYQLALDEIKKEIDKMLEK